MTPPAASRKTLLLGPGCSTWRLPVGSKPFGSDPAEQLWVVDRNVRVLKFWETRGAQVLHAGLQFEDCYATTESDSKPDPLLGWLDGGGFDEVHAYEILNLLPGSITEFFRLWRFIYDALAERGRVWATVPHWESQWIHAYPAPQRTYTPGLLGYLNRASANPVQEDFSDFWPEPYDFRIDNSWVLSSPDGKPQGWHFCLMKAQKPGGPA